MYWKRSTPKLASVLDNPCVDGYKDSMIKTLRIVVLLALAAGCANLPTPISSVLDGSSGQTELPNGSPGAPPNSGIQAVNPIEPTAVPSATSLPNPTLIPPLTTNVIEQFILNGEYGKVRADLTTTTTAEGLWLLGKTEFLAENSAAALESLRAVTVQFPGSIQAQRSWYLLGEIYTSLERYEEAIFAYEMFGRLSPLFATEIKEKTANCYSFSGQYSKAIELYEQVLATKPENEKVRTKIGRAYLFNDQPEQALAIFDEIAGSTKDDYTKAQMDLLAGQALINAGRQDEAFARWTNAVVNYPLAFDSYTALNGLQTYEQPVSELDKGLVSYFAGDHDAALLAFNSYLEQSPQNDGTVYFYIGLIQRESGSYTQAINAFDTLINDHPENRMFNSAWDEKAYTQWAYLDDYKGAAETLELYASLFPGNNLAATYLLEAGRVRERGKDLEVAARVWESLPVQFPDSNERFVALMYAGTTRYRLNQFDLAKENFDRALQISKNDEEVIRSNFWLGKTALAMGNGTDANFIWQKLISTDPLGYYGLRADEILNGKQPWQSQPNLMDSQPISMIKERTDAAVWLKLTASLPAEMDLLQLGTIQEDIHFIQGLEYWNMGMFEYAKGEFDQLEAQLENDPAALFSLGNYLIDIGAIKNGITALRQALTALGYDDHYQSTNVPPYFNKARYGLYYYDLVKSECEKYGLDPLLVTSLIRQESLFEGFIHSSAGARGVMQIMPATGESISANMGWPAGYSADMLYQPNVSIGLGTWYLNSNLNYLQGNIPVALAGYNAGPGNAAIWAELAGNDPDLFVEVVRYGETRDYVRGIYETYRMYQKLYTANK